MSGTYVVKSSEDGTPLILWPITEVARQVRRHKKTIYCHAREGRLELVHDGGRTYVEAKELERYRQSFMEVTT